MGFYEAATVVGLASGAALGGRLYESFGHLAFTLVALEVPGGHVAVLAVAAEPDAFRLEVIADPVTHRP